MSKWIVSLSLLTCLTAGTAAAQAPPQSAQQSVSLTVNKIAKLTVGGTISLTIDEANAGVDGLEVVSASGNYKRVNNYAPAKITAAINQVLDPGFKLEVEFQNDNSGFVDVSGATAAVDVVTGLARGAVGNGTVNYRFSATPEAGTLATTTRTLTFTLTE